MEKLIKSSSAISVFKTARLFHKTSGSVLIKKNNNYKKLDI